MHQLFSVYTGRAISIRLLDGSARVFLVLTITFVLEMYVCVLFADLSCYFQGVAIGDPSCINCSINDVFVTGSIRFDQILMIASREEANSAISNKVINQVILVTNMIIMAESAPLLQNLTLMDENQ